MRTGCWWAHTPTTRARACGRFWLFCLGLRLVVVWLGFPDFTIKEKEEANDSSKRRWRNDTTLATTVAAAAPTAVAAPRGGMVVILAINTTTTTTNTTTTTTVTGKGLLTQVVAAVAVAVAVALVVAVVTGACLTRPVTKDTNHAGQSTTTTPPIAPWTTTATAKAPAAVQQGILETNQTPREAARVVGQHHPIRYISILVEGANTAVAVAVMTVAAAAAPAAAVHGKAAATVPAAAVVVAASTAEE